MNNRRLRRILRRWLVPPGIGDFFSRVFGSIGTRKQKSSLSSPEQSLLALSTAMSPRWEPFRDRVQKVQRYAEYGSGESTIYVATNTAASIRSIETDPHWVELVSANCPRPVDVRHIDLGPTGDWGRPRSYEQSEKFPQYFGAPFAENYSPDFILIDGRFRVACFLTCIQLAEPGTVIVFDDYVSRPQYHVVEEVLSPTSLGSRQAVFIRPTKVPQAKAEQMLERFTFVMD